jgi:UDP:flavonoid glycosyltransferase YjiC (YdhE family)
MKRMIVLATAGAGGDLQPLMAAALRMQQRGHHLAFLGDEAVAQAVTTLGISCRPIPEELDMGRILGGVYKRLGGMTLAEQGHVLRDELSTWSQQVGALVSDLIKAERPDLVITSLFGIGAADVAATAAGIPWAMVNSTFYIGPQPPRPLNLDFGARAVPLIESFLPLIERAHLALHATDRVFDFDHTGLPINHRYVGPLIGEPNGSAPAYIDEPGDPWVLVTVSSQTQDDVTIARSTMDGLASLPVRVLVTTGGSHPLEALQPLPANARAEAYVSHAAVLRRAQALVSHAGHGSVMKALWHGVPMVLVPWGRDQPGVAARAERLGVARVLSRDQIDPNLLAGAVQDAMNDATYRVAAGLHSARLQESDPAEVAAVALESA